MAVASTAAAPVVARTLIVDAAAARAQTAPAPANVPCAFSNPIKTTFEQVTGVGKPSAASMHRFIRRRMACASCPHGPLLDSWIGDAASRRPGSADRAAGPWRVGRRNGFGLKPLSEHR